MVGSSDPVEAEIRIVDSWYSGAELSATGPSWEPSLGMTTLVAANARCVAFEQKVHGLTPCRLQPPASASYRVTFEGSIYHHGCLPNRSVDRPTLD